MTVSIRSALRRSDLKHAAWLASGTVLAQLVSIAVLPLVTRLYTPTEFGIFAIYMAISSILTTMGAARYEEAIILARRDAEAARLVALCLTVVILIAVGTAFVLALAAWVLPLPPSPAITEAAELSVWLPLTVLASGLLQTLTVWCNRLQQYGRISTSQLTRAFVAAGGKVAGGLVGLGSTGLIGGAVLGHIVAAGVMTLQAFRGHRVELGQGARKGLRRRPFLALARRYRDFPLYSLPRNLLNSAALAMPGFLLAIMLGPVAAGLYWFVYRLMQIPLALSGASLNRVVYQRAAEMFRQGESLVPLMLRVMLSLGLSALVPAVLAVFWGPQLFAVVFGPEWERAGTYAQWLGVWWVVRMAATPAFTFVPVLNLQHRLLVMEMAALVFRSLGVIVGALLGGDIAAIACFALVSIVYNLGVIFTVVGEIRHPGVNAAAVSPFGG